MRALPHLLLAVLVGRGPQVDVYPAGNWATSVIAGERDPMFESRSQFTRSIARGVQLTGMASEMRKPRSVNPIQNQKPPRTEGSSRSVRNPPRNRDFSAVHRSTQLVA